MERSKLLASLAIMFAGFQAGKDIDPAMANELVRPILTFPDHIIDKAIWNFRNLAVPDMDKHYPPSIPEIVGECRRLLTREAELAAYATRALPPPAVSDAERKRVGAKMVKLAAKLNREAEARREERREAVRQRLRKTGEFWQARDPRSAEERGRALLDALDRKAIGA